MYKRNPFTLTLILLIIMAAIVYFCEPLLTSNAFGCEVGDTESGQAAESQNATSSVGNSTQSSTSGDDAQHEGNGGESWTLIDCNDPFWWGLVPCADGQR